MLLTDKKTEALDLENNLMGVFLDFSKPLDTVDHEILLEKLGKYGLQGVELQCFVIISLIGCNMWHNNHKSQKEKITCSVPQGSILGALLFLLYFSNLANAYSHSFSILFADYSNMFISGRKLDVPCNQLNEDLREVQESLVKGRWGLRIHVVNMTPTDGV